jgi:hypothetical protein
VPGCISGSSPNVSISSQKLPTSWSVAISDVTLSNDLFAKLTVAKRRQSSGLVTQDEPLFVDTSGSVGVPARHKLTIHLDDRVLTR